MPTIEKFKESFLNLISLFETDQQIKFDCLRANYYFFSQYQHYGQNTSKIVYSKILPCLQNLIYETKKKAGIVNNEKFKRKWNPKTGLRGSIYSCDSMPGKDTNIKQFVKILNKIKKYTQQHFQNDRIINIIHVSQVNENEQIEITMQRGLGIKPNSLNYVAQNQLFNNLSNELQKKFMISSMDSLAKLHQLNIEHCDVTYRNFVLIQTRFKVIDLDSAIQITKQKVQQQNKDKNKKDIKRQDSFLLNNSNQIQMLNQSKNGMSLSDKSSQKSLSQSEIIKNSEFKFIRFFSIEQLKQYSKDKKQFNQKYFGKYDVATFGFMIARLLLDNKKINTNQYDFISQTVGTLQKIAYPDQNLKYNKRDVEKFLPKNFRQKHFKLIHFVLEKMMVPSFAKRSKFNDIQNEWKKMANQILDELAIPEIINKNNPSFNLKLQSNQINEINQNQTAYLKVAKEKKYNETWNGYPNTSQKQKITKQSPKHKSGMNCSLQKNQKYDIKRNQKEVQKKSNTSEALTILEMGQKSNYQKQKPKQIKKQQQYKNDPLLTPYWRIGENKKQQKNKIIQITKENLNTSKQCRNSFQFSIINIALSGYKIASYPLNMSRSSLLNGQHPNSQPLGIRQLIPAQRQNQLCYKNKDLLRTNKNFRSKNVYQSKKNISEQKQQQTPIIKEPVYKIQQQYKQIKPQRKFNSKSISKNQSQSQQIKQQSQKDRLRSRSRGLKPVSKKETQSILPSIDKPGKFK